jgi:hypothetical protein
VWRNGIQIGQAPMSIRSGARPPEGVFLMLEGSGPANPRFPGIRMHPWTAISLDGGNPSNDAIQTLRSQLVLPEDFHKKVNRLLTPGTILVTTAKPSNASTRSATNFSILKTAESP